MTKTHESHRGFAVNGLLALALATSATLLSVGCKNGQTGQQAPIVDGSASTDPAQENMAPVDPNAQTAAMQPVATAPGYSGGSTRASYARSTAPATRVRAQVYQNGDDSGGYAVAPQGTQNESTQYRQQPYDSGQYQQPYSSGAYQQGYDSGQYEQPYDNGASVSDDQLYAELLDPTVPEAQQPPPPLPVYEQPPAPGPDYLWTPGYWDYANTGYYYVPGNWVAAPFVGALWTPGWWGYYGSAYRWHHGYWGPHVGYYGGVNYGFGFIGLGYQGGYWNRDHFYYNTYVNHVQPTVVNNYVYNRRVTVINNTYINNTRISYAGGPGGLSRRPTPAEFAAVREVHMRALPGQIAVRQQAAQNRAQFFADNHGRPSMVYASRPIDQHNVAVPPQLQHLQPNPQAFQQRIQAEQQRQQLQQQQNLQRANAEQQNQLRQQQGNQQRVQAEQQNQLRQQQFNQQRLNAEQQNQLRQQQNQQRANVEQQNELRQQQNQVRQEQQNQQRVQAEQQNQLRQQQQNQLRQQQQNQQRANVEQQNQLRQQQQTQQRANVEQQNQVRQQQIQQRQQAEQQNQQRQQAMNQQRVQMEQQRQQQASQQRAAEQQQRQQAIQQRQVEQRQAAPQARPMPQQHFEAPHSAPAPRMEAPHGDRH